MKQLLRSATSIGANIHEAYSAASKADFINKMQIALKEASETDYWLIVLERTGYYDPTFAPIKPQVHALKKMHKDKVSERMTFLKRIKILQMAFLYFMKNQFGV